MCKLEDMLCVYSPAVNVANFFINLYISICFKRTLSPTHIYSYIKIHRKRLQLAQNEKSRNIYGTKKLNCKFCENCKIFCKFLHIT